MPQESGLHSRVESGELDAAGFVRLTRRDRLQMWLIAKGVSFVIKSLACTYRTRVCGIEHVKELDRSNSGYMMLTWHGRVLASLCYFRGRPIHAMVSMSRDGELQVRFFRCFGWPTVRGSSGRGGVRALAHASRLLKQGKIVGVTPDGPKGPEREVQQGAAYLAQRTGCAVVPVGSAANRAWHLPTWDHYLIPKPFSRVVIFCGDPIRIETPDGDLEGIAHQLRDAINAATEEAERLVGN